MPEYKTEGGPVAAVSTTVNTYVWSAGYIDQMVSRDRDVNVVDPAESGSYTSFERLYVQQDANFNTTSLTDISGAVVERYVYDPYGQQRVLTSNWQPTTGNYDWVYLHQGGR